MFIFIYQQNIEKRFIVIGRQISVETNQSGNFSTVSRSNSMRFIKPLTRKVIVSHFDLISWFSDFA